MRQASRRSWRIGQTEPVQVVFMAYRNTLQADALRLVAQKLQSSLAVEGELPEDGLAAYGDDGDDLMLALARKIVAGEEDAGSVESVFEQARQVAAEAEALLVDEELARPGARAGRRWSRSSPVTGADDLPEEDGAPQRTLFSWAEFMAGEAGGARAVPGADAGTRPPRSRSSSGRWTASRRGSWSAQPADSPHEWGRRPRDDAPSLPLCVGPFVR